MGDEVEVLEQGLAFDGLQRAATDGEGRQTHAQLLEVMAQVGSGRRRPVSTVVQQGGMLQRHRRNIPKLATEAGRVNAFPRKRATSVDKRAEAVLELLEYAGDTTAF